MENAKDKKEEQTKNADTSAAREMRCSCAGYMERIKAIDSMEDMGQNVWEALHMFRKLNIGSILPHLNKGEFVDERHLPCAEENRFRAWCKDV